MRLCASRHRLTMRWQFLATNHSRSIPHAAVVTGRFVHPDVHLSSFQRHSAFGSTERGRCTCRRFQSILCCTKPTFKEPVADSSVDEAVLVDIKETQQAEAQAGSLALAVAAAFAFGGAIWATKGAEPAQEYFAGYIIEQTLSIDNLFVFILVFKYFKTPVQYQSKVLAWGLLTAAVLRFVMIELGVELVEMFRPLLVGFAGIVLYSAYKLLFLEDSADEDLSDNWVVKLCQRMIPVSYNYDQDRLFIIEDGVRKATPLLLALAVIELSDVLFAVDSVPAVFGVTLDPFIIYTSNLFAILSLRSLYSFVASAIAQLRYLDKAVALVLGFIGVKLLGDFVEIKIRTDVSLLVVAALLSGGVAASLLLPKADEEDSDASSNS